MTVDILANQRQKTTNDITEDTPMLIAAATRRVEERDV
jgi:hypothetical protein